MNEQPTRPTAETRAAEREEAHTDPAADREPTPDEEQRAEALELDPEVAEHEKEMAERGAQPAGRGQAPVASRGCVGERAGSVGEQRGLETGDLEHLAHRRLRTDDADRARSAFSRSRL